MIQIDRSGCKKKQIKLPSQILKSKSKVIKIASFNPFIFISFPLNPPRKNGFGEKTQTFKTSCSACPTKAKRKI